MSIEVGSHVPNIELVADSGEKVSLTDYKGKYVVSVSYTHLTLPTK